MVEEFDCENPYRKRFYALQKRWHGYESLDQVRQHHRRRAAYYKWYTKDWLPADRTQPVLDIACGAGQFLYFLRQEGFSNTIGVDIDKEQIAIGAQLGLNCEHGDAAKFLEGNVTRYSMISCLDILEHMTQAEACHLLDLVRSHLRAEGRLIISVPNAESPRAMSVLYGDITHETAFTRTSLGEMLMCNGLHLLECRDPWPAPIDMRRRVYRCVAKFGRALEAMWLKALGLGVPTIWSPVMWCCAQPCVDEEKPPGG
jgi:2-polyprenyl-3-methyl-5-hydroxy-6-metoxy-1,4-benzoquinol methylase